MSKVGIKPFLSLFHKEVARFFKVMLQTICTPAVNSALYFLIFGLSMGDRIGNVQNTPYLLFIMPGLITMGAINNAFQNSSSSITVSKFGGDLEDLKVAPFTPHQLVWAMGLAGMVRGLIISLVIVIMGQLFYLMTSHNLFVVFQPLYALFFLMISSLTFAFFGVFIGFYAKSFEQITFFSTFFLLPLSYLGGVFFSLEDLHPLWQQVTLFNPIFYFINAVKYSMLGKGDISLQSSFVASLIIFIFSYSLAYLGIKRGSFERFH